jgi:class 3 adenylate cyclase
VLADGPDSLAVTPSRRSTVAAVAWLMAALLPLVGLVSLLARSKLDPGWTNTRVHFVLFLSVATVDFVLSYAAADAARRRGDARVLLISLAFLATGGFLGLHGLGTPGILFTGEHAGFKVAVPVGMLVASTFALASAFVDTRPGLDAWTIRHKELLRTSIYVAMAAWFAITLVDLPPLDRPVSEGGSGSLLAILAAGGTAIYGLAAIRYYGVYMQSPGLLPASIIACYLLLAESMIGVAVTGERAWHASWWLWHGLIVLAFVIVGFAARRQWRDERFRALYLAGTRERHQDVSVLFSDLAGFTSFSERMAPAETSAMLKEYYELAAPIIARGGGEIEHFTGDGIMAVFNARGDCPDHPLRAARAALGLSAAMARLGEAHPTWPRLRVGVNSGDAIIRELGGHGHVAYSAVGDSVNVGARLEAHAPVGGVLVGAETYRRLPDGTVAEAMPGLRVKGKDAAVDAFVLRAVP